MKAPQLGVQAVQRGVPKYMWEASSIEKLLSPALIPQSQKQKQ